MCRTVLAMVSRRSSRAELHVNVLGSRFRLIGGRARGQRRQGLNTGRDVSCGVADLFGGPAEREDDGVR